VDWERVPHKRCHTDLLDDEGELTQGFCNQHWSLTREKPPNCPKKMGSTTHGSPSASTSSTPSMANPTPQLVSVNTFSPLDDDVIIGDIETPNQQPRGSTNGSADNERSFDNSKKNHLPPIIIRGQNLLAVTDLLKSQKIINYNMKLMSVGISVYIQNKSEFVKFKDLLIDRKLPFYSYLPDDEKLTKFVLYGLEMITEDDLRKELQQFNITPVDIKTMVLKKQRFDKETLFLLSFNKEDITLNDLRKIKALFHIIVRWEHYTRKSSGPLQCRRCQMYGHPAQNCHLPPRCIKCGENHESKNCIHNQTTTDSPVPRIPDALIKCTNCEGKHTANYHLCPERQRYEQVMSQVRNKNIGKRVFRPQMSSQRTDKTAFPAFNNNNAATGRSPLYQHYHVSDLQIGASRNPNTTPQTNITNRSNVKNVSNCNDNNQNLLSAEQLMAIMRELIVKLRGCRDRLDQLEVISNLALRFIGNGI
jgi:hypothetical protein